MKKIEFQTFQQIGAEDIVKNLIHFKILIVSCESLTKSETWIVHWIVQTNRF